MKQVINMNWVREPLVDTKTAKIQEKRMDFFSGCPSATEFASNEEHRFLLDGVSMAFVESIINPTISWAIHNFGVLKISVSDVNWSLPLSLIPVHFSGDIPINYYSLRLHHGSDNGGGVSLLLTPLHIPSATIYLPESYLKDFYGTGIELTIRLYLVGLYGKPRMENG